MPAPSRRRQLYLHQLRFPPHSSVCLPHPPGESTSLPDPSVLQNRPHGFLIGAGRGFTGDEQATTLSSGAGRRYRRRLEARHLPPRPDFLSLPALLPALYRTNFSSDNSVSHRKSDLGGDPSLTVLHQTSSTGQVTHTEAEERRGEAGGVTVLPEPYQTHFSDSDHLAKRPKKNETSEAQLYVTPIPGLKVTMTAQALANP